MKTVAAILFLTLSLCLSTLAQQAVDEIRVMDTTRMKIYRTWVYPVYKGAPLKGALYKVNDSSILISNSLSKMDLIYGSFEIIGESPENIRKIALRKKGKNGRGILIGSTAGLAMGITLGTINSSGHSDDIQDVASFFIGFVCTGLGILAGTLAGSDKKYIPVMGNQAQFAMNKARLDEYAILHDTKGKVFTGGNFSRLRDTIKDIDGNFYHTLALGGQVWMAENLKVKHFRDGTEVPDANIRGSGTKTRYDWNAVKDHRLLCPAGWHVPSMAEWTSLFNSLGGTQGAVEKLDEGFASHDPAGQWWSSDETDPRHAQCFPGNKEGRGIVLTITTKNSNLSVRCLRDH